MESTPFRYLREIKNIENCCCILNRLFMMKVTAPKYQIKGEIKVSQK